MTITLCARRVASLGAAALAVGFGAFAAAPAQAHSATPLAPATTSTAPPTHSTASGKTSSVIPNVLCDTIVSNGNLIALCSVGFYYDGGDPYRWPVTHLNTTLTANRVWFHQNRNSTGWADCYSGGGSYNITGRDRDPGNIQISANTAPC